MKFCKKWLLIVPACLLIGQAKPMKKTSQEPTLTEALSVLFKAGKNGAYKLFNLTKKTVQDIKKETIKKNAEKQENILKKELHKIKKQLKKTRKIIKELESSDKKTEAKQIIETLTLKVAEFKLKKYSLEIELAEFDDTDE